MQWFVQTKCAVDTEWNTCVVSVISSHISLTVNNTDERKLLKSYKLSHACMLSIYSELSPCGHLAITDARISGESYRGLNENDSNYYGLAPLRNCGHFSWYQNDTFIVLTLDKAYTTFLSYDVIMLNYSVLFIICQNTKYFWNVIFTFFFFVCTIVLASQPLPMLLIAC